MIDEVGWQAAVPAAAQSAYTGFESVAVASERAQAGVYSELVRRSACDRTVAGVFLFPLLDEPDLERFQSGIVRADASRRPSFDAVRSAVAGTRRGCSGRSVSWRHARTVVGARVTFGTTARVNPARRRWWGFSVSAGEDARVSASVVRVAGGARSLATAAPREPRGRPPRGRGRPRSSQAAPPVRATHASLRFLRVRGAAPCGDEPVAPDDGRERSVRSCGRGAGLTHRVQTCTSCTLFISRRTDYDSPHLRGHLPTVKGVGGAVDED